MSMTAKLCTLLVVLSPLLTDASLGPLRPVFEWKELDFEFPNDSSRQSALQSGYFVPGNSLPIDVQYVDGRVFITMPRWKEGIPATVATVPASPSECVKGKRCAPLLQPFPDWSWNSGDKSCEGLTSVFRINLDKCGRLWIIDSGAVSILSSEKKNLCPPQLLSFDLSNDQLIRRYTFPNNLFKPDSLLITVALDTVSTAKNCANTYAYSADVTGYGLIVTDTKRGNSWRVENKLFYPYPNWGTFNVAGESFDLMDGVISLAIHPELNPETRRLYFHSMASARENYVQASLLRNATQANLRTGEFIYSRGEKPSQAAASAFDSRGILFFGLLSKNSLACWNPATSHIASNIKDVAQDDEALQFASTVKVDNEDNVWMITNRFSSYFLGTLNSSNVNFRVMVGPTMQLTRGTICEEGARGSGGGYQPLVFN